ncbi:MAG: DegV family protein [Coriobacteriales bacterium]
MPQHSFAIVTDSACDVSPEELEEWGVSCINLQVSDQAGNPLASDNSPQSVEAFYDWMAAHDELPKTSMPSPLAFGELYSELARQGYTRIVSLHMSEAMSGTVNCARMAAQSAPVRVDVVNLRRNTLTQALLVRLASIMRDEGSTADEVLAALEEVIPASSVCFAVDELDNLVKGGRVGHATGLVANVLNIKPLLTVGQDGAVESIGIAKSMKRAVSRLVKKAEELVAELGPLEGYLIHVRNLEALDMLRKGLEEKGVAFRELGVRQVGPIIATHVGLGCVGFAYIPSKG